MLAASVMGWIWLAGCTATLAMAFGQSEPLALVDGLGERYLFRHPHRGMVEVLDLRPELVRQPGLETMIGRRAVQMNAAGPCAVVHTQLVERRGAGIRVTSAHVKGLRLSVLLRHMEHLPGRVPIPTVLTIAHGLARALALIHQLPDEPVHGVLMPEHVVLTPDGSVLLTDTALVDVLAGLGCERPQLWSTFGVLAQASAGRLRFDQRQDVTQMAGIVLQLAIGRPLLVADGLRLPELVASVMLGGEERRIGPAARFRAWLYRALQLPSSGVFASGVEAERAFAAIISQGDQQQNVRAIRLLVHQLAVATPGEADWHAVLPSHPRSA